MATIDLGELTRADGPAPPDPLIPPGAYRWWRRLTPEAVRRAVGVVGLVALLGATATAAARPVPAFTEVFSVDIGLQGAFEVVGDALVVTRGRVTGGSIAAYDLASGDRRWENPVAELDGVTTWAQPVELGDGLLAVTTGRDNIGPVSTTMYDVRTGDLLWTRSALGWFGGRGPNLVFGEPTAGGAEGEDLVGVDARTGAVRWTVPVPLGTLAAVSVHWEPWVPGTSARFVTVDEGGLLTARNTATGAITGQRRVAPLEQRSVMQIFGEMVILHVPGGFAAFDVDDMDPLWTVTVPHPESAGGSGPCGRFLCVSLLTGTHAMDPATGTVRWVLPGYSVLGNAGGRYLMAYPVEARSGEPRAWEEIEVISAETGERLVSAPSWHPDRLPGPYLQRWNQDRTRMWLGVLSADGRRLHPIGSIGGLRDFCFVREPFVVCSAQGERVQVWRMAHRR